MEVRNPTTAAILSILRMCHFGCGSSLLFFIISTARPLVWEDLIGSVLVLAAAVVSWGSFTMFSTVQEKTRHMPRNNWYVTGMSLMKEMIPSILMPIVVAMIVRYLFTLWSVDVVV